MGKVNVYLPDGLEREVREAGIAVSPVCQMALQDALDRLAAARHGDRAQLTPHLREVLDDVQSAAADAGRQVTARDVFGGIVHHLENLGARTLTSLGIDLPSPRRLPRGRSRRGEGDLAADARDLLGAAFRIAVEMRHRAVGAEHIVIALADPPSPFSDLFDALGYDSRRLREQVERLLANPLAGAAGAPAAIDIDERATIARLEAELQRLATEVEEARRKFEQ